MVSLKKPTKQKPPDEKSNVHALAYKVLGLGPAKHFPYAKNIRENLLRAHIKVNHVMYISSMVFWSLVAGILACPLSFLLFMFLLPIHQVFISPVFAVIYSLLIGLLVGAVTFGVFLYYPIYVASNIKRNIEKDLVYTVNYMSILNNAGTTPEETFGSLVRVGKVFGIADSAKDIMKNVEFLGEDTITSVDEESKRTPSRDYADFLQGYIATTRTGGSSQAYFQAMAEKFMDAQKRQLTKVIDQLNIAGEVFVAALVAFPIIMITMFSIMGLFGGEVMAGLSALQLMLLMTYGLIPFIAVGILIFIDAAMSSW